MKSGETLLCRHGSINQVIPLPKNPVGYMSTMPKGTVLEHCAPTGKQGRKAFHKTYWTSNGDGTVRIDREYSNCK